MDADLRKGPGRMAKVVVSITSCKLQLTASPDNGIHIAKLQQVGS